MIATKISSKGQVVIPKEVREKLKIKPGTFFHVRLEKNHIVLIPMKKSPLDKLYGKFSGEKILADLEREHSDEIASDNHP